MYIASRHSHKGPWNEHEKDPLAVVHSRAIRHAVCLWDLHFTAFLLADVRLEKVLTLMHVGGRAGNPQVLLPTQC